MNRITFCLLTLITTTLAAQDSTYQNLYFYKKNSQSFDKAGYRPGKHAFYIYRNCIYDLVLKNGKQVSARVIDIKSDSIYCTGYSLHPSQLKKIRLIGDRLMGLYSSYSLRHCTYVFETNAQPKAFPPFMDTVYAKDSSRSTVYEIVPYLTAQGLDHLYQQCGITYYYEGIGEPACEDTTSKAPPVIKKVVWFTPSGANKIKGVNLGIQVMNTDGKPIAINGVNISADILSAFLSFYAMFSIPSTNSMINMPDTIERSKMRDTVTGFSISGGGLVVDMMKGVSISGLTSLVTELKGIAATGLLNNTDAFKGVEICSLRNRAIRGRGIQIGLLNICKDLKGIQLGLWNVNSRRKLPIINWSF